VNSTQVILAGGVVIITVGVINALTVKKPLTPVFAGGVGILLISGLIASFGGNAEKLAEGFVGLAAIAVVLADGSALFKALSKVQGTSTTSTIKGDKPTPKKA